MLSTIAVASGDRFVFAGQGPRTTVGWSKIVIFLLSIAMSEAPSEIMPKKLHHHDRS